MGFVRRRKRRGFAFLGWFLEVFSGENEATKVEKKDEKRKELVEE